TIDRGRTTILEHIDPHDVARIDAREKQARRHAEWERRVIDDEQRTRVAERRHASNAHGKLSAAHAFDGHAGEPACEEILHSGGACRLVAGERDGADRAGYLAPLLFTISDRDAVARYCAHHGLVAPLCVACTVCAAKTAAKTHGHE